MAISSLSQTLDTIHRVCIPCRHTRYIDHLYTTWKCISPRPVPRIPYIHENQRANPCLCHRTRHRSQSRFHDRKDNSRYDRKRISRCPCPRTMDKRNCRRHLLPSYVRCKDLLIRMKDK